nr:unnamed protein product [Callosobruchus analis]
MQNPNSASGCNEHQVYRPVRTVYTDGSKSNSGAGAAVVGEGEIWKGSVNVMSSIYTAELTLYQVLT